MADLLEGPSTEDRPASRCEVDPVQLSFSLCQSPIGDGAIHQDGPDLDLVVNGANPSQDWQSHSRMPHGRGTIAHVHGQLGQQGMRHGRRPGSVIVAYQRESTLGRRDSACRVAFVLQQAAQPVARRHRCAAVLAFG